MQSSRHIGLKPDHVKHIKYLRHTENKQRQDKCGLDSHARLKA